MANERTDGQTEESTKGLTPFQSKRAFNGDLMSGITERTRRLLVRCPILLRDLNEIWGFSTDFHEVPNLKVHRNVSSGSRADTCVETDRRTSRVQKPCLSIIFSAFETW